MSVMKYRVKNADGTLGEWVAIDVIKGDQGVSPTVAVAAIDGGHRVTITDKDGAKSVDVMDGDTSVAFMTKSEPLTAGVVAQLYGEGIRLIVIEDGYTNLVPKATDAAGRVYRGCGYLDKYRLTSSGGLTSSENCCVSGFMPYTHGTTIRIVGSCGDALSYGGQYVGVYDADYNVIQIAYQSALASSGAATWEPRADGLWALTIDTSKVTAWSNAKYFRVSCALCVGADLKVTVNEPIGLEV